MANEKRYFWLRLYDDFFTSKRIKRLRSLAGGDTYTIIYLKMQLKALKSEGYLYFDNVMGDFAEELSLDIDESADDVRVTIQYLLSVGLLECSADGAEYFLTFMPNLIGSESASTQRVRDFRNRKKEHEALHCNTSVTEVKQVGNAEKEIEKEIEIDKEKDIEVSSLRSDTSCGKPSKSAKPQPPKEPEEPAVITLILNDKSEYGITQKMIDEYKECYPALDIMQELRSMKAWCISNPQNRKTRSGVRRFINNWLSKSQNRYGGRSIQSTKAQQANDLIRQLQAEEEFNEKK